MKFSAWFLLIASLFTTCLITANIIAVKLALLGGVMFPAGVVIFPLSYLFGDVLTEVYGYSASRVVIWLGFLGNLLAVAAFSLASILPAAPIWHDQTAYNAILGFTPRLLLASFISYLIGEFVNSFVLAKLKIATQGRYLWMRTIGSTLLGEGIDTTIFISIAFWGSLPFSVIITLILTQWIIKVLYEVVATPLTYLIVGFLKAREQLDIYDRQTNFNPFLLFQAAKPRADVSSPSKTLAS
ncbi:transporter [Dictyobacter alpinus]|uniref:Probable queuosine precursor transporter n=1 Tax=Dictyobacter alpinus TaxID=2014873 RepID=A0A402BLA1_9CHLR|nr:queuosine precursor transporter [Dictyobacter alpinus]GCE32137.1 transporter [Dictyobacter alpinus]